VTQTLEILEILPETLIVSFEDSAQAGYCLMQAACHAGTGLRVKGENKPLKQRRA